MRGHIISDGGITCPGDVAKAIGGGADFVMMGGVCGSVHTCVWGVHTRNILRTHRECRRARKYASAHAHCECMLMHARMNRHAGGPR